MDIQLKMFLNFKAYLPPDADDGTARVSIQDGATIESLLSALGVPVQEPKIVILNGLSKGMSHEVNECVLRDGDVVSFFPPIAGG